MYAECEPPVFKERVLNATAREMVSMYDCLEKAAWLIFLMVLKNTQNSIKKKKK